MAFYSQDAPPTKNAPRDPPQNVLQTHYEVNNVTLQRHDEVPNVVVFYSQDGSHVQRQYLEGAERPTLAYISAHREKCDMRFAPRWVGRIERPSSVPSKMLA